MGNNEQIISNDVKYLNYKEQNKRLKKALNEHFYLEALFIEYAIIEDRTESILRYENNQMNPKKRSSIESKLNKIKTIAREKKGLANKYFSEAFIDEILNWKEKRNSLIHALMKQVLTTDELETIAFQGKELSQKLSSKSTLYKKAVEKLLNQQIKG